MKLKLKQPLNFHKELQKKEREQRVQGGRERAINDTVSIKLQQQIQVRRVGLNANTAIPGKPSGKNDSATE